jgi:predicted transcriptional regulator
MATDVVKENEMSTAKSIGDQELALLRYVAEGGPVSVGQVVEGFGAPRGLARSTVLTMMERLRLKGHLEREPADGVYRYFSPATSGEVMRGAVRTFVEKTLSGSVSPFVAYLTETVKVSDVSDTELAELEELVARLKSRRKED